MVRRHNGWPVRKEWSMCQNWCDYLSNRCYMVGNTTLFNNSYKEERMKKNLYKFRDKLVAPLGKHRPLASWENLSRTVETVDFVGGVGYFSDCAVWLNQWVWPMHYTVCQRFFLMFVVTGVWIAHSIAEAINSRFTKMLAYSLKLMKPSSCLIIPSPIEEWPMVMTKFCSIANISEYSLIYL